MHILGVHLDFPFLRTSLIRKGKKGIEVLESKAFPLIEEPEERSEESPQKQKWISGPFSNQNSAFRVQKIVSGLSAKDFLIRSMEMKISNNRHVEEAIAFQSEALSHFKPEEVITIPILTKRRKGKAEALLFTVPREGLSQHLKELENLQIDPDVVSTVPSALCRYIRWKFPKLNDAFIVDLGSNEITCACLENGELKKSHAILIGVEKLLDALYEDRKRVLLKKEIEGAAKQIDLLLLKSGLRDRPEINRTVGSDLDDFSAAGIALNTCKEKSSRDESSFPSRSVRVIPGRSLNPHLSEELNALKQELKKAYYFFTRSKTLPVIFTGRSDAFIHLREFLIDFTETEWPLTIEEQKFAVSIGLVLEQTAAHPLQLLTGEFFPRKNWVKMGLYALLLLAASAILSGAFVGMGLRSSALKKHQMLNALQVSSSGSEDQIDQWIDAIEKSNKEYPYILQAPKVAEVLMWLSAHPLLEEMKNEGDPINIREVGYQLVGFPTIDSENDPFLAKVEIEFQFKSMMNARKFHEALRIGDEMVNPDLEITWDALSDSYRTSFFTKNRSPYVS